MRAGAEIPHKVKGGGRGEYIYISLVKINKQTIYELPNRSSRLV